MDILLVEDNDSISKGLEYTLKQEGYTVLVAKNLTDAKNFFNTNVFRLAILDICLPDGDGFDLCKNIKNKNDIPVIFLTAKDEETDVIQGLELGADDYVIKPFRIRELVTRIKTVLRRYERGEKDTNKVTIKNIQIDFDNACLYKNNQQIELTALEYKILSMLFANIGKIVTREQILDKIWDIAGNFVNDNTLTVYIKRIREKLEDNPQEPQIIKTIRGIGYRIDKEEV